MKAYIALVEEVALKADAEKCLTKKMLGTHVHYLAFKETLEEALHRAKIGTGMNGRIAIEEVRLYILELTWTDEEFLQLYHNETVRRNKCKGGWEWSGPLDLNTVSHTWSQCTLAPIGLDAWADMILGDRYKGKTASFCKECESSGVTTWCSRKARNQDYCARCWQSFFYERNKVQPDAPSEDTEEAQ
eukprot:TRINITY_DN1837_c0_g1_i1.p1 TRINITY_DN1837_c0_g1~~TRINITY_DN1837_c0_g1_i1.p1  ORF type:complete len:188 (-),score=37.85 TRINITY_DN1837_c0_g1_i1:112-675(-)